MDGGRRGYHERVVYGQDMKRWIVSSKGFFFLNILTNKSIYINSFRAKLFM
jgi:hypothetical protein